MLLNIYYISSDYIFDLIKCYLSKHMITKFQGRLNFKFIDICKNIIVKMLNNLKQDCFKFYTNNFSNY